MIYALLSLGIAAALGLAMTLTILTRATNPSWKLVGAHGVFAVVGVLFVVGALTIHNQVLILRFALVFFLVTAVAGLGLLSVHLRGGALSIKHVAGHAAMGVIGFGLLIASFFTIAG